MSSTTILDVRRVAGHIGAEIRGIDIAHPLDPSTCGDPPGPARHKVVFFRGQTLDHAAQIAFARQFGELTYAHPHDDAPPEDLPQIFTIDPHRFEAAVRQGLPGAVPQAAVLLLRRLAHRRHRRRQPARRPRSCGPRPCPQYRRRHPVDQPGRRVRGAVRAAPGLRGRRFVPSTATARATDRPGRRQRLTAAGSTTTCWSPSTPWCGSIPQTGERALFVNPGFTSRIVGVTPRRAAAFSTCSTSRSPVLSTRCASAGSRAASHSGTTGPPPTSRPRDLDHLDVERTLHRVTLIGDRPVGPDGFVSEIVEGREFKAESLVVA